MTKKEIRHQQILSILKDHSGISNAIILKSLGIDIDRKTLQRDLKTLEGKKLISSIGAGRGQVYRLSASN